jgi:hypothetical protein
MDLITQAMVADHISRSSSDAYKPKKPKPPKPKPKPKAVELAVLMFGVTVVLAIAGAIGWMLGVR